MWQELGKLQAASTTVNDHARERQRLEEQLEAALAKEDYTEAAKLQQQIEALPPASAQAASTTVNDHARERQRLEEQLNSWTYADIHPP